MAFGTVLNLVNAGFRRSGFLNYRSALLTIQGQSGMGQAAFAKIGSQIGVSGWEDTSDTNTGRFFIVQMAQAWPTRSPMQILFAYTDGNTAFAGYTGQPQNGNFIWVAPFGGWDPVAKQFASGTIVYAWNASGYGQPNYWNNDDLCVFAYSGTTGQPGWIALVEKGSGATDNIWQYTMIAGAATPLVADPLSQHGFVVYGRIDMGQLASRGAAAGGVWHPASAQIHTATLYCPNTFPEVVQARASRLPLILDDTVSQRCFGHLEGLTGCSSSVGGQFDVDDQNGLIRLGGIAWPKVV